MELHKNGKLTDGAVFWLCVSIVVITAVLKYFIGE